jgi:hypothetical protein
LSGAAGYFEALVNQHAYHETPDDGRVASQVVAAVQAVVPGSQVRWAGSQRKGTAVTASDLDLCVESPTPITEGQRRDLRAALERDLRRPARVQSHAVRLPSHDGKPKVDIAFANAAFGSRPLPEITAFHNQRSRQVAARALKLWASASKFPRLSGWVIEAIVVHLDPNPGTHAPLELFVRILAWLDERATAPVLEGVLRPAAFPRWNEAWSAVLPGRLEALRNRARAQRRRTNGPETWGSITDADRWLRG